jgi:hypothetical protein
MVGQVLGAPRKKCQTPPKEGTRTIELNLRRTEHDYYRNRCLINARPITYVFDDQESISLSPSNLLYGRRLTSMPNDEVFEIQSTNRSLTRRARHQRNVMQQFTN